MLDGLLAKVFGTKHDREIKAIRPIVAAINNLEPELKTLSDADLAAKTQEFKQRLSNGASLESTHLKLIFYNEQVHRGSLLKLCRNSHLAIFVINF
jgi:preprotein translocase subunit SecA